MTESDLETAILRLPPKARARLAEKLLESLEAISPEEQDELWASEALRRDAEMDQHPERGRSNEAVFADARARLR